MGLAVTVTGTPHSGTQLLCRLIEEGGHTAYHDKSHGELPCPAPIVVITRNLRAVRASLAARSERIMATYENSLPRLFHRYPLDLWVTYEELCAERDYTLARVAAHLRVPEWRVTEECVSQNEKWLR